MLGMPCTAEETDCARGASAESPQQKGRLTCSASRKERFVNGRQRRDSILRSSATQGTWSSSLTMAEDFENSEDFVSVRHPSAFLGGDREIRNRDISGGVPGPSPKLRVSPLSVDGPGPPRCRALHQDVRRGVAPGLSVLDPGLPEECGGTQQDERGYLHCRHGYVPRSEV